MLHDHVIKVPNEVGQNAGIPEVPSLGHILQLSRQLARLAWPGDETVANNNHLLSLLSANRTIAARPSSDFPKDKPIILCCYVLLCT
jgi:hypothetical protein